MTPSQKYPSPSNLHTEPMLVIRENQDFKMHRPTDAWALKSLMVVLEAQLNQTKSLTTTMATLKAPPPAASGFDIRK